MGQAWLVWLGMCNLESFSSLCWLPRTTKGWVGGDEWGQGLLGDGKEKAAKADLPLEFVYHRSANSWESVCLPLRNSRCSMSKFSSSDAPVKTKHHFLVDTQVAIRKWLYQFATIPYNFQGFSCWDREGLRLAPLMIRTLGKAQQDASLFILSYLQWIMHTLGNALIFFEIVW